MRRQQRRQSALSWIQSGATTVTIKTYARRYGVDRYTAYEDLTAVGFSLPASAQHWAHRPAPTPRPWRQHADSHPPSTDWVMMDGRPYFVAGYTPAGFPYGIYADEMGDLDGIEEPEKECDMPWPMHPRHLEALHDEEHGGPPSGIALRDTMSEGGPF